MIECAVHKLWMQSAWHSARHEAAALQRQTISLTCTDVYRKVLLRC